MSTNTETAVNGTSIFLPLLAVLFIGLKLTGVIAWSWWWVLAPLWVPTALFLGFAAIAWAVYLIARK